LGGAIADEGVIDEQLAVANEGFGVEAAGGLAGNDAVVETADGVVAILVEAEEPDGGVWGLGVLGQWLGTNWGQDWRRKLNVVTIQDTR
jgi:hypothetical protein